MTRAATKIVRALASAFASAFAFAFTFAFTLAFAFSSRVEAAPLALRAAASAELIYNDAVELLFDEMEAPRPGGDQPDNPAVPAAGKSSIGLGLDVDGSLAVEARPFRWLSFRLRPDVFAQLFFDRADALVLRLSPPVLLQLRLGDRVTLLAANEFVANLVPGLSRFTFYRETATARLAYQPIAPLMLRADYVTRIKNYPQRPSWDFRSHRFGASAAVEVGAHLRLSAGYAFQLNTGSVSIDPPSLGTQARGWQHIPQASLRLGFGDHLVELAWQLRLARGGDALVAVDQPLLSPSGALEEDTDELSSGGFDKHIVELTYDLRLGRRVTADLYGRWSRKSYERLVSTADPRKLRVDDLWLIGANVAVKLARGLSVEARALYRINTSSDPEFSFRNLILAAGVRWER